MNANNLRIRTGCGFRQRLLKGVTAIAALAAVTGSPAWAGSADLGHDVHLQYTAALTYTLAVRTAGRSGNLVNGATDPATGLSTTINSDDGDRAFAGGSIVNDRLAGLGSTLFTWHNYGVLIRGDAFYDQAYHGYDDSDSPQTTNHTGTYNKFTSGTLNRLGQRLRLLDAYGYGNWHLGGSSYLNLRAGRQVVAWGQSLFFSGISTAQGPVDAAQSFVPGVEVKDILLPVNQVSMQLGLTNRLNLLAYYRLQYKPNELSPVGSYFSTTDLVGPGAQFAYLAVNPAGGAPLTFQRAADITPSDFGQWGVGLQYQLTDVTSVGVYRLRYHDTNPAVVVNSAPVMVAPGVTIPLPVSYNIKYFDGIDLTAASFSTSLGPVNVAGEALYRDGIDMLVTSNSVATRGKATQLLVSALYTVNPNFISREIDLAGEVGYLHVNQVDAVGGSTTLTNSKNSWAFEGQATFHYFNVFQGWDMTVPITFGAIFRGTPAVSGAFGSLYGQGDQRLGIGANFTYLQNLQLGVSYAAFLGTPNLTQHPYADRDYAAITASYNF